MQHPQLLRQLNALTRTQAQRDRIKNDLINHNGENLDARHDGFYLEGREVRYNLPDGTYLILIMTEEEKKQLDGVEMRKRALESFTETKKR